LAGNVTVVETLLAAGADHLVVDDDGVTALMSAASQGHTEVAR
jgi:ankyrin repeat protein